MAICNFNENEQTFVVNLISSLSTDCSTTYQYEIISENGEEVNITLIGNHSNTIYISNGVEYPFIDNVTVFFRNSLIVTFSLLNSGVGGYFNKTTLAIINNDTLSPVNAIYNTQTRLNDEPICGSGGVTGPESYVSDVAVVGNDLVFTGLEDAFNSTISLPSPITRKTYSHSVQKFDAGQGPIDLWLSMKTLTTSTEIFNNSTGEADLINVVASDIYTSSMIAPKDCYLSNIQFQGNTGTAIGIGLVMLYDGVTTIVFENNAIVQENNFSFDYDFATTLIIPQDAILYFFIKPSSTGLYGSFQFHITETNGSIFSETPSSGINLTTSGVSGPATLLGNILNIPVYTGGAGGTGVVETIVPGTNITVDDTDPANPIISSSGGGVTDHTLLTNIGTNTHTQIDSHIADATIHFTQASISITESQISDLGPYNNYVHPTGDGNLHVPANSTTNNGKVLTSGATAGVYTWETIPAGVTDHTLLSNIGTNTHAQIDTHIADTTIHFTQAEISITESQISDLTHFAPTNLLTDYGFTDNSVTWNALVTFPGFGTLSGDYGYAEPTHALADLTDVDATVASPTDGKILVYRSAGTDWVLEDKPIPGGGGATQLNELSDVTNVTYTNRHVLVADGVDYDSRALVEADISDLGTYLTTLAFAGLSDYPTDAIGSLTNDGAGNLTWSASGSSLPVVDTTAVVKGSVDATKLLRFEVDGISTSTTRIINQPDYNVNLNDVYYIDGGDANVNISEGGVSPTYGDSIPEEEQISGTRLTNATVIGSTALDWSAYKTFEFTLTGITTLTDSNLPAGTNTKVIELIITGDFALTLPTYWEALPSNDNYVGTVRNHLVVSCINGTTSSEDVIYSLQNLTT